MLSCMAHPNQGRKQAIRLYPLLAWCQRCKVKRAEDRHHKDGNTFNNKSSNIAHLCRTCHMTEDGRLVALIAAGKRWTKQKSSSPNKVCIICGDIKSRPRWKGRCHACDIYFRRRREERSIFLANPIKMTCKYGHEFSAENTYFTKTGRSCRACHADRERKRRIEARKAKVQSQPQWSRK